MASFQSVMKSPLVSDMLTMHVMVGRQTVIVFEPVECCALDSKVGGE